MEREISISAASVLACVAAVVKLTEHFCCTLVYFTSSAESLAARRRGLSVCLRVSLAKINR